MTKYMDFRGLGDLVDVMRLQARLLTLWYWGVKAALDAVMGAL